MGAGAASKAGLGETFEWKLSHALAVLLTQSKQDITRTDNDYTHSNILRGGLQVRFRYKELCTLYMLCLSGYAELFNRKGSIIFTFIVLYQKQR